MDLSFLMVGTPRSGTTLVQRLACELPDVAMSPETHFFSSGYARALVARGGFPLVEDRLDEEVAAFASSYRTWVGEDLPLDAPRIAELAGPCYSPIELFSAIVRSLAGAGSILGEKTPDHIRWWRPIARASPAVKFVFVVRDPRAVVESILRMPWGSDSHVALAERWRMDQRNLLAAERALGRRRCLVVRYEDVVADDQGCRRSLTSFLGDRDGTPDRADEGDRSITLPWETWKERAFEPVTSDRIDIWSASLPPDQALDIAAICHAEMKRFGYPVPGNALLAYRRRSRFHLELRRRDRRIRRSLKRRQALIDATKL